MDPRRQLAEVQRLAHLLYADSLRGLRGVLHCASSVRSADGRLHVIKIGEHAPRSAADFFVLNLARASADAILTSAQVVRAEPQLSHQLQGPLAEGLALYRREQLGQNEPPLVAVLTRSAQLPAEHRVFREHLKTLVLTAPEQVPALSQQLTASEVSGVPDLDARRAVALLQQRGARTILIEAGPSAAAALYAAPGCVDHLWLSRCEGEVDARALGGALPVPEQLFAGLVCAAEHVVQEPSGPWRFQHWRRSDG